MNRDLVLAVFLLLVVGGAGWWLYSQPDGEVQSTTPTEAVETATPEPRSEPVYIVPLVEDPQNLVDLPSLGDSDAYFRLELRSLFGSALDRVLVDSGGIERFVATIDNLPRKTVAESIRPLRPVAGSIIVEDGAIAAANAERYDLHVALLTQSDVDELVGAYRRFYPLLQEGYERLGYPDAYFNDRLIEVIDHLLLTPDIDGPLTVDRPHVLFEYTDPKIEALSAGQKILLRIGPQHASAVKTRLRELRDRLTTLGS